MRHGHRVGGRVTVPGRRGHRAGSCTFEPGARDARNDPSIWRYALRLRYRITEWQLHSLGTCVVQPDVILNVQVTAPVADLGCPRIRSNLHDRSVMFEMNRHSLLSVLKVSSCGRRYIVVRTVSDGYAGLGHRCIQSKALDINRFGV